MTQEVEGEVAQQCGRCTLFVRGGLQPYAIVNKNTFKLERHSYVGDRNCSAGDSGISSNTCIRPEEFQARV